MQRGDVDRQVGVGLAQPRRVLAAELEHAPVDRLDRTAFLGDLQERRRPEHAAGRVVPAQQCLVAHHRAVGQPMDRLQVRFELVVVQRLAQFALQRQHVDRLALQRRVEQHVAAATQRLGAVQRGVGIAHQFVGQTVALVANRDADARRWRNHLAGHVHRLPELFQHALGDHRGGAGHVYVLEQDRELVARQARDDIGVAHAGLQAGGDRLEHFVAGEVAKAVVDDLESVDVEVQQCAAVAGLVPEPGQRAVEALAQVVAVGQAGQGVVHHLVLELVLDALALVDLLAQLAGAHQHALLQQHHRLVLVVRGAAAGQAVGDLRGDEAQQLRVGLSIPLRFLVALNRDQPDRRVADHQRRAQPACGQRADRIELDLAALGQRQGVGLADDQLAVPQHVLAQAA